MVWRETCRPKMRSDKTVSKEVNFEMIGDEGHNIRNLSKLDYPVYPRSRMRLLNKNTVNSNHGMECGA